jgi:hypothetical protein
VIKSAFIKGLILFSICILAACSQKMQPEDPAIWSKVKFDPKKLDKSGQIGPDDGKVVLNYEFCIPAQPANWTEARALDTTLVKMPGNRGRVACRKDQWLLIGSTGQPRFRRVLYRLASLPYVSEIREVDWE